MLHKESINDKLRVMIEVLKFYLIVRTRAS